MFKFAVCTVLFWTVVPFVIPLLTILFIYRGCVILLQKIVHPNWIGIMNPRDMVVWEEMENPRLQSVLTSVMIFQGKVDLEKFRNGFMDKVISYRNPEGEFSYAKFQHYFENWMGFPFWKKEERFDIKQHIQFLTPEKSQNQSENENKSQVMTEEELHKICGDLMTRPFQPKTSPWEILIVPNYQPKNYQQMDSKGKIFAAVFRKSHTILDGFSFQKLFTERLCGERMESIPVQPKPRGIFRIGSLQRVLEIVLNVGMYHAEFFLLDRDVNIWHGNGKGSKKLTGKVYTVKCDEIPFSVTRSVSKKLGVAPTATMFSCVAGGIRRFLEMEQAEIPDKMTGFFPWPVENHPMEGLVNHWSFVDIVLPVGKADAVRRISEANASFQALKKSPLPKLIWNVSALASAVPTPFFNVLGWNRKSTLNLTNFPGISRNEDRPLLLFGQWKHLDSTYFLARLRGNTAVQVHLATDSGIIHVTISVDRGILTERGSKQLAQCITEEFKALEDLAPPRQETRIGNKM